MSDYGRLVLYFKPDDSVLECVLVDLNDNPYFKIYRGSDDMIHFEALTTSMQMSALVDLHHPARVTFLSRGIDERVDAWLLCCDGGYGLTFSHPGFPHLNSD